MKKSALKEFIRSQIITELNIEDETKALEDYEAKLDAVIKKKEEAGLTEEDTSDAMDYDTYVALAQGYLQGFNRPHSLNKDELEVVGRKIVKQLYKGNIDRAVGELTEEEGPTKADIKKTQGLAKTKEDLARIEREMKSVAKKWSKAKGEEKETLLNTLKNKTKIKKELVKLLDKV